MLGIFKEQKPTKTKRTADTVKKTRTKKVTRVAEPKISTKKLPAEIRELLADAKEEALRVIREAENEASKIRKESIELEKKLAIRQEELDKRFSQLEIKEKELQELDKDLEKQKQDLVSRLEKISGLTKEEAKKTVLENIESHLAQDIGKRIKEAEDKIREEAQKKAHEILADAMLLGAIDWIPELTTSVVKLPNPDIKGRIIGKEGRNIRTFEEKAGVEVLLDEEIPDEARISSFDPVRREIARRSLERLIRDTRIQPQRIEDEVERAKKELEKDMSEAGREGLHKAGIFNIHDGEVLDVLGRLNLRYSYGQNQLVSGIEASKMADQIAAELGADRAVAKVGAFFHDIGKAITDQEGTHVQLGVEFLTRKGFPKKVIDCVSEHHEDKPFSSVESVIVHLADKISSSIPGARHEDVQEYARRMKELEEKSKEFKGVKEAYAIEAGRQIRIIVDPQNVSDSEMEKLAHDIAEKLQGELAYPGQIKVNVIREKRAVAYAV